MTFRNVCIVEIENKNSQRHMIFIVYSKKNYI